MKRFPVAGLILLAFSCLLVGPVVNADWCRSRTIYPSYCPPVVKQRTVYQQHHFTPKVQHKKVIVPKALKVNVSPDYYYSVADYYRDKLLVDAITGRIVDLQNKGAFRAPDADEKYQEILRMVLQLQAGRQGKIMSPAQDSTVPNVQSTNVNPEVVKIIQSQCVRCHNDQTKKGGLSLTNLDALEECDWWKIYGLVNTGEMPKGGKPVTDEQTKLFYHQARNFKK